MDEPEAYPPDPDLDPGDIDFDHEELRVFWELGRYHAKLNAAPTYFGPTTLESVPPPAWSYGQTPAESDAFVAQVLADREGRISAQAVDYGDEIPETGVLSIVCDGAGKPRALVEVTEVATLGDEVIESFRVVFSD